MQSVELEECIERRCTLYEQFTYQDEYQSRHAFMALSDNERREQRERDKEDFLEWLWLSPLAGGLAGKIGLEELQRLREFAKACELTLGRADLHHDTLEALIKEAVEDDLIIPVIDRTEEFSGGYTAPASASSPSFSGGLLGGAPIAAMSSLSGALSGEPILSGPYDPATQGARVIAARTATGDAGAAGGNFDLLGFGKVAASAILGGATSDAAGGESSPDMLTKSFGGDGASGSLPADARPFDYLPDEPSGEVNELAGMPFNGEPGTWISSMPGTMPQLRQYGPNGTPLTDFDFEAHHGNPNPHAHNWDGYRRDNGAPVSLLPW
jgi:hypothetical protein